MRKFSSYGPVNTKLHYYTPREELINEAFTQLIGENPDEGGHYITVWASRQAGKTWIMQQVLWGIEEDAQYERFDAVKINLQHLKRLQDVNKTVQYIAEELAKKLGIGELEIDTLEKFPLIFQKDILKKPLILILDEFDALQEEAISGLAGVFRNIYISRQDQAHKITEEKDFLLHGVALIGVRSVLGLENVSGSPFNVQRSLHIPNLTYEEVKGMFTWYEQESGQHIDPEVIDRLYYETKGQPGLTCWLGELLTETYNENQPAIAMKDFDMTYAAATYALPNSNIVNIISKAKQEPYKQLVLELFKTEEKIEFKYDNADINFLYLNGVIDREMTDDMRYFVKFPCPFVQKRLFNYFSNELFSYMGKLYDPFEDLTHIITDKGIINMRNLLRRYEQYLKQNRGWLLKDAPRRSDLRIYEAVYHFNLYMYLHDFLKRKKGSVYPEFPTGNGKIDLIIRYNDRMYGLEVKSYADTSQYQDALSQAAGYGKQLQLPEISLAFFVEYIDDENRNKYEAVYVDPETGVTVRPIFVAIGE